MWIKDIEWKKVLGLAVVYTLISFTVQTIESAYGVGSIQNPGVPAADFLIRSVIFTFATGIMLAVIYYYLRNHLPKNKTKRTLYFADLLVATSFVFFTLPVYLLFNVSTTLLIIWFITTFIILVIYSFMLVKVLK